MMKKSSNSRRKPKQLDPYQNLPIYLAALAVWEETGKHRVYEDIVKEIKQQRR